MFYNDWLDIFPLKSIYSCVKIIKQKVYKRQDEIASKAFV